MTCYLTRCVKIGPGLKAQIEFKLADMWIGVYWARKDGYLDVWVCLLPCLPIHIRTFGE